MSDNCGNNIMELFDILTNFSFATSETVVIICNKNGFYKLLNELRRNLRLFQENPNTAITFTLVSILPLKTEILFILVKISKARD